MSDEEKRTGKVVSDRSGSVLGGEQKELQSDIDLGQDAREQEVTDLTDSVDTLHAMNAAKTEAQEKRNSAVSPEDAFACWAINLEAAELESFLFFIGQSS